MPTNGHRSPTQARSTNYRFYRTFGHAGASQGRPRRVWPWLVAAALLLVALYGLMTLGYLLLQSFRADYENTRLPPYDKNLIFSLSSSRLAVGESGRIGIELANPGQQDITVRGVEVDVPPRFLDAFVVDDGRCKVERRPDASGTIRCPAGTVLHPGAKEIFDIAIQAGSPGNYDGVMRLRLALTVPALAHPWYRPTDAVGNYNMALDQARGIEVRIVPRS